jgi:alpha-L-rhamnosidase
VDTGVPAPLTHAHTWEPSLSPSSAAPDTPRFEHRTDSGPVLGMGSSTPRLSWTVPRADPLWAQTAYEVEVTRNGIPETYHVDEAEQVLVPWPAPPLTSRERAEVRVRVACGEQWTAWGETGVVEAGLLEPEDWSGRFITPDGIGCEGERAPIVSGVLDVPGLVRSARLYATAHGVYVPRVNGSRVDDTVLAPGWTSYRHRLRYHVYDVTDVVRSGTNTLEVLLGNGWYRGRLGFMNQRALYGHRLALLAQLEVTTADGAVHVLCSDGTWRSRESEIVADDMYDGQSTDLRLRGDSGREAGVAVLDADLTGLVAPEGPPVRPTDVIPACRVWETPSGAILVDFGQNAVGWVRLRVRGLPTGREVTVRHAEVLEDGELGTVPLRSARATDTWVMSGTEEELLEPCLTLHGFRYAQVSGVPHLRREDIDLVVVGSDLRRVGWFTSSNELLNRLHENVAWSARGNFVDVPMDCPQRDERLGWTGDIQVFAPTATFLFDSTGFLSSWLADLAAEQRPDGCVPHVVPDVLRTALSTSPAAAWGDAATVVPWTLYQRTGDLAVLKAQFASMRAWVDCEATAAGRDRLWTGGFQYGDWLDPTAPPEDPARAKSDPDVVATAHLARSAEIVARTAVLLGLDDVARRYRDLAAEVRQAFAHAFVTPAGRVLSDSQTVYALAIQWNLLPQESQRQAAGLRLADLVRASGFHISTGFVGTPLVCDALTSTGHPELAYRMLLQTGCPSWLYPVTMGATTIWERWDSMQPDGSINPSGMTSFNHYALGAVADWMHRVVAGLAPAAPGYREILVRPQVTAGLSSASARHLTPYGEAEVAWRRVHGRLDLRVVVPVGVTAHVHLPDASGAQAVTHGQHDWSVPDPVDQAAGQRMPRTVRELLDDVDAWNAVVTTAAEFDVDDIAVATRLAAYLDAPVERLPQLFTIDEWVPGALSLRRRLAATLVAIAGARTRTTTVGQLAAATGATHR